MHVIVDFILVPIGVGVSFSPYIAACERVLREAGLEPLMHANGTSVEGDWDVIFGAVRKCHEKVHEMGAPRVSVNMRVGTRTDRAQTMADKVNSVNEKLSSDGGRD